MAADLDLVNRDPNNLNQHLSCQFEEVLGEPEGTHSIDCVWKLSYSCFTFWKNCCYKISTLLCGICIAACWGCEFAQVSFQHIWYFTPCFKLLDMNCGCLKRCYGMCIGCCLEPCCDAASRIFSAFKK